MRKIIPILLKETEIVEVEGEYQERVVSEKKYPAALTHKSLQLGADLGILKSSKLVDLLGFNEVKVDPVSKEEAEAIAKEVAGDFDPIRFLQVIYLAVIGFNKNLDLTFEDFLEQYTASTEEMMETFSILIDNYMSDETNNFAAELKKSTKKKRQQGNKK